MLKPSKYWISIDQDLYIDLITDLDKLIQK